MPFADAALRCVRNGGGILGITVTDLTALTGSSPRKTRRRYGSSVINDELRHESGIRVLLGYLARRAASYDRAIEPILSFWHSHYYRVFIRVREGAALADRCLSNVGMFNRKHHLLSFYGDIDEGPLWVAGMNDPAFLGRMDRSFLDRNGNRLLDTLLHEDSMPYFIEAVHLARHLRLSLPPISSFIDEIERAGAQAYRTHLSPTGVKVKGGAGTESVIVAYRNALSSGGV
ncbi:hypothetical protein [Thermogymnomonas acidicola]|uniref:hypothetical protein n=1 Tax=Thermogymnomonas acidicola TaxID=399579 RepID=UPI00094617BF|nr:hypothetical protein [Thermogymnomonas acidicola]